MELEVEVLKRIDTEHVLNTIVALAEEAEELADKVKVLTSVAAIRAKMGDVDRACRDLDAIVNLTVEIEDVWNRSELLAHIVSEITDIGMLDKAIEIADKVEDKIALSMALADIASALARRGAVERALHLFKQASHMANEERDEDWTPTALEKIGETMVRAGLVDEAVSIADEVDIAFRPYMLTDIAEALIERGEKEKAIRALNKAFREAEELADVKERVCALSCIADSLINADAPDKAYEVLQRAISYMENADTELRRSWVWEDVVSSLVRIGRFREAIDLAKRIEDRETRLRALSEIADNTANIIREVLSIMVDVGEVEEAIKLAMRGRDDRVSSFMAKLLLDLGEMEKALEMAERTSYEYRVQVLNRVIDAALKAGDVEKAIEMAKRIYFPNLDLRWEKLADIAEHLALSGAVDRALNLVSEIEDVDQRVQALADMAFTLAESGKLDQARRVLKYAFHATRDVKNTIERAWALLDLADVMAAADIRDIPVILACMRLALPDKVGPGGGELKLSLEAYEDIGAMSVDLSAWLEHLELDRPVLRFRSLQAGARRKRKVGLRPKHAGEFTLPINIRLNRVDISLEPSTPCMRLRAVLGREVQSS